MKKLNHLLEKLSHFVTEWAGSSWAFGLSLLILVVWGVTGPFCGFSDTWQLVINTGTTIITFLMVFLLQRSHNKESLAIQIKLNSLIAALDNADNSLLDVEDMSEADIRKIAEYYKNIAKDLEKKALERTAQ